MLKHIMDVKCKYYTNEALIKNENVDTQLLCFWYCCCPCTMCLYFMIHISDCHISLANTVLKLKRRDPITQLLSHSNIIILAALKC